MFNYKFWLFVVWIIIGIANLHSKRISKVQYFFAWFVVAVFYLTNWLLSVGC